MRRTPALLTTSFALFLSVLLAGCTGTDGAQSLPSSPATVPPPTPVTDATGAVFSPLPRDARVVDAGFLSISLAGLGIAPVGVGYPASTTATLTPDLPAADAALLRGTPVVSDSFEVDPERVVSLRPDVVLTTSTYAGVFAPALEALPSDVRVFTLDDTTTTWQQRTRTLGALLSVPDRAEAAVAAAEGATAQLRTDVAAAGRTGEVVSVVRGGLAEGGAGQLEAYVPPSLPSELISAVGLRQPDAQRAGSGDLLPGAQQFARIGVSLERLGEQDGDAIITLVVAGQSDDSVVTSSPLWSRLRAVVAGRVTRAPYLLWTSGSATGVTRIVADLRAAVLR